MWFEPLSCVATSEDSITLAVPNDFAAIWIHDNYLDLISQRLRLTAGRLVQVNLKRSDNGKAAPAEAAPRVKPVPPRRAARYDERLASGSLNPRNTFENFVIGANNQLAHAASVAVAQAPAQAYNPL
ncbi:MAG: DnaA/Hda family protein, partial [Gemmataceae bacterium]|nr:DnaA/Hda family protein [Gemmataceae bacterium]